MWKNWLIGSAIIIILSFSVADSQSQSKIQKVYPSSEILELINDGIDIYLEDAVIVGDLKLNQSQKIVNSSISIKTSDIMGDIDFGNAFFKKSITFGGTIFSGNYVNFLNSEFASDIDFSGAGFKCNAYFSGTETNGNMTFIKTTWSEGAYFEGVHCKGFALFRTLTLTNWGIH
jgi:hypothetical protein